jgi:hypothetical protein
MSLPRLQWLEGRSVSDKTAANTGRVDDGLALMQQRNSCLTKDFTF